MKKIPLIKVKFTIIDDEDYPYLSRFKWDYTSTNFATTHIYNNNQKAVTIPMHYFLIKYLNQKYVVKHKNNNTLDNRKSNLVMVERGIGAHMKRKYKMRSDNKTGISSEFKGVSYIKTKRSKKHWHSSIIHKTNRTYLGLFETEKEAALAYNKKAKELYGEYAYQNKLNNYVKLA